MSGEQLIELNYEPNLHSHYQNLSHLPGFVLLESRDQHWGRYDILSAYPYERVVIPADCSDVADTLNNLRESFSVHSSSLNLPFQAGAIGYFSYDLGAKLLGTVENSLFEPRRLDSSCQQTQPLLNDFPLLNLGFYDWAIIVDHHLKKVFLYAAHQQAQTKELILYIMELWKKTKSSMTFKLIRDFNPLMSKKHYEHSFYKIKQALKEGRSYQVNFTQAFQAEYQGDTWAMYAQVCKNNPVPFAAYLHDDKEDILSFSPERFLLHDKGQLLTSPIKGTMRRSPNLFEDEQLKNKLRSCPKNRAENVMIVDLLRNDLGKIAQAGTVLVDKLFEVQSYNSVHHLVSDVKAQALTSYSLLDLFLACFPGGSITGAPKIESMKIINELEPHARGIYCGSVVYFSRHGRFDSNIAIRTLIAKNNYLHLAAGGGIVIDSDCEDEYRECFIKINAILNGLK